MNFILVFVESKNFVFVNFFFYRNEMYEYYYVLAKKKEMNVMNFCCKILGNYKKKKIL